MRTRSTLIVLALAAASLAPAAAMASTTVLYDGTLNTLPTSQGWFYGDDTGGGVQSITSNTAHLDTTSNILTRAGYAHFGATMDNNVGYTLNFTSAVTNENQYQQQPLRL